MKDISSYIFIYKINLGGIRVLGMIDSDYFSMFSRGIPMDTFTAIYSDIPIGVNKLCDNFYNQICKRCK